MRGGRSRGHPSTGSWRVHLPYRLAELVETLFPQCLRLERQRARQQLVEHHTQRIHICPGVDVEAAHLGLLGTHVFRRADERTYLRVERPIGQRLCRCLRHAEVDHFRHWAVVANCHEDVRGFQITVDDAFLVGVLNSLADGQEQIDAFGNRQRVPRGVRRNRLAAHVLHDEIWAALRSGTRLEDPRNSRMVHQGQCLTLGLEASHHLRRVHARLDHLQRDLSVNGLGLLGEPNLAHAALADPLKQAVRADCFGRLDTRRLRPRQIGIAGRGVVR